MNRRSMLRISLRSLLLVAAVVPVAAYWLILPTLNARRYVAALESANYPAADALCVPPDQAFPGDWTKHAHFDVRPSLNPLTWSDFTSGQRRLFVGISYGDGGGIASCSVECVATRRGIEVGMFAP